MSVSTRVRSLTLVVGALLLAIIVASIADNLLRAQHVCEKCGREMQPFENASLIYKCPDKDCGFMIDLGFQR